MKTRKLSSDEILELVEKEIWNWRQSSVINPKGIIDNIRLKIEYIENIKTKNKFSKWIDRNQGNFWFFIMITAVLFTAKVAIEAYLLNK